MGYAAQPFAVDLGKVRQVLGSNDTFRESKIVWPLRHLCKSIRRPWLWRKETGGLFGLFKNKQVSGLNPKFAHKYGYALLVICGTLGTNLSEAGDIFYAGDFWKEANELFKSKGMTIDLDRMWETEKLFDIPDIADSCN
jgi:hypothetical protein